MCSNVVTKLCSPFMCQLYLTIKCYVGAEPGPLRVTSGFCCHTDLSLFLRFHFSCLPPNRQLVLHSDALDGCKASGVGEENSRRAFLPGFPFAKSCRSIWGDLEEVKPEAIFFFKMIITVKELRWEGGFFFSPAQRTQRVCLGCSSWKNSLIGGRYLERDRVNRIIGAP